MKYYKNDLTTLAKRIKPFVLHQIAESSSCVAFTCTASSWEADGGSGTSRKLYFGEYLKFRGYDDDTVDEPGFGAADLQHGTAPFDDYMSASGSFSFVAGRNNAATAIYSSAFGQNARAAVPSSILLGVKPSGEDSESTFQQGGRYVLTGPSAGIEHDDASFHKLKNADGDGIVFSNAYSGGVAFRVLVVGVETSGSSYFAYEIVGLMSIVVGGSAALKSSTRTVIHEDTSTFDARVTVQHESVLHVEVQDGAGGGDEVYWTAHIYTAEDCRIS